MIRVEIKDKRYGENIIFSDFALEFAKNKTSVLLGPSGIGKTTLLNIVSGLDKDFSGKVPTDMKVSYVFQEDRLIKWKTVVENLKFILGKEDIAESKIEEILSMLNMVEFKNAMVKNLSGGQRQRVSISRAFLYPSEIILMDEPFKSLDAHLKVKILTDLDKVIKKEKRTIILVTHSIREALFLGDDIYIVNKSPISNFSKLSLSDSNKQEIKQNSYKMLEYENILYNKMISGD